MTVDVTDPSTRSRTAPTSGVITRYFYNAVNLGVQLEATHVHAHARGTTLPA